MNPRERLRKYLREGVPPDIAKECVDQDIEAIGAMAEGYLWPTEEEDLHGLGEGQEEGPEPDEGSATWEDLGYEPDGSAGDFGE